MSQSKENWIEDILWKNSLFDSLFLVNKGFSLIFSMFWKDTMYGFLYWENKGLERLLEDVRFIPNLSFNAEKLVFRNFWNPSMRTHAHVRVRMHEACLCGSGACVCIRVYAYASPRVSMAFDSKNYLACKKYKIFHKQPSSSQIKSNQALNHLWALEFYHHWGMGAWVCRCPSFDS